MSSPVSGKRYDRTIRRAKKAARSELEGSQWSECGYARTFSLDHTNIVDLCPRVDALHTTLEEFRDKYERPNRPVVIQNDQLDWEANKKWTLKWKWKNSPPPRNHNRCNYKILKL